MTEADPEDLESLREGLKAVGVALKESGRPFALAGGYAAWVHGSPEPLHDVDFLIRPEDADAVAGARGRGGLEGGGPAGGWLCKVRVEGAVGDVIHRAQSGTVDDMLAGSGEVSV